MAALVGLVACEGGLPSPSRVDSLRILAMPTETPAVRPGLSATVRAVWFDPQALRRRTFLWRVCPETEGFDPRDCARPSVGTTLQRSEAEGVTVPSERLGAVGRVVVWVLLCPGDEAVVDAGEGRLRCGGTEGFEAFRRLTVSAEGPWPPPPAVLTWTLSRGDRRVSLAESPATVSGLGACAGDCPAWEVAVTADPARLHPEARLLASFLATSGVYSRPRDALAEGESLRPLTAGFVPERVPGEVRVWVVLRDQQGGEDARETVLRLAE